MSERRFVLVVRTNAVRLDCPLRAKNGHCAPLPRTQACGVGTLEELELQSEMYASGSKRPFSIAIETDQISKRDRNQTADTASLCALS
jgi:hypothetical protein